MNHYLFVGLGNPGAKYKKTRHNLGIRVLRAWTEHKKNQARNFKDWHVDTRCNAEVAQLAFDNTIITCLFPLTFMNTSGQAVRCFWRKRFSRLWRPRPLGQMLIVHDELDMSLGEVRHIVSGSPRGHNGIRSIHRHLGSRDIPRLLLGIGPKPDNAISQFVLGNFLLTEEEKVAQLMPAAFEHLTRVAN